MRRGIKPFGSYVRLVDDFNRANETPLAQGWSKTNSTSAANINLSSNAITSSASTTGASFWSREDFGPDLEAYFTITVKPPSTEQAGVTWRMQQSAGADTWDGYQFIVFAQTGTDTWQLQRVLNAVGTNVATGTQEFAVGDKFGIRHIGGVIESWYLATGTSNWVLLNTTLEWTYGQFGKVGIRISSTTTRVDDIYAGTIPPLILPVTDLITDAAVAATTYRPRVMVF